MNLIHFVNLVDCRIGKVADNVGELLLHHGQNFLHIRDYSLGRKVDALNICKGTLNYAV